MILQGYITPYSDFSFSIPVYTDGKDLFYHQLNKNLRIEEFELLETKNFELINVNNLIEVGIGDFGIIIFIGEKQEAIINYANLIVPQVFNNLRTNINARLNLIKELHQIVQKTEKVVFANTLQHFSVRPYNENSTIDLIFNESKLNEDFFISYLSREKTINCRNIFVYCENFAEEKDIQLNSVTVYFLNKSKNNAIDLNSFQNFCHKKQISTPESMLIANNVMSKLKEGELYYFIDNYQNSKSDFHMALFEYHYKSLNMNKRDYLIKALNSYSDMDYPMQIFKTRTILSAMAILSASNFLIPTVFSELWKYVLKRNISRQITFLELESDSTSNCRELTCKNSFGKFLDKVKNTVANILYK
jgi:hypothetical protein